MNRMNIDKLLFEKVLVFKYKSQNTIGTMIVKHDYYMKKARQFKKAFKDCTIYFMQECILTPEIVKELDL